MNAEHDTSETPDVQAKNCPMAVIKTEGRSDDLQPGEPTEITHAKDVIIEEAVPE